MAYEIRLLGAADESVLARVADGVFDNPVDPRWSREFLNDPRHHIAVAIDDGLVVGMTSGVHYVHPDKAPQLFINEVAVAPTHQRRGIAAKLLAAILERGRELGCTEAWVATEETNAPARKLYTGGAGVEPHESFLMYTFRFDAAEPESA
jgi:ribosomal protein S18 acetylase RimI-like enzyme